MTTETQQVHIYPRLNERAPEFEAKTTHGVIKLSDYDVTDWYFSKTKV